MEERRNEEESTSERVRLEREAAARRVLAGLHAEQMGGAEESRDGRAARGEDGPGIEAGAGQKQPFDEARAEPGEERAEPRLAAPAPWAADPSAAAAPVTAPEVDGAEGPASAESTPGAYTERASLSIRGGFMPPPLRGSLASLERQDERLQADGLEPIEDEADLSARIAHHLLVPLPLSAALTVNAQLPAHHRYCRPWTARFLSDLARAHDAAFHRPLEVSSAVRPVAYQAELMRINGNAAPARGSIFSPHEMGAAVDIAKRQMTFDEIEWMRRHLLALELEGKIDVEEEFEQACFHISVYRSYGPAHATRPSLARSARSRRGANRTRPYPAADSPAGQ